MSALRQLPVDIVLDVLKYLPLSTLIVLPCLSKSCAKFMKTNESPIFHYTAVRYGFSSMCVSLVDTNAASPTQYNAASWKAWCLRRSQVESSWLGQGPSICLAREVSFHEVHRIKVDEKARYVITTFVAGGIMVTNLVMTGPQVLWSLPNTYVRPCAHCEYSNGFIIFDRGNTQREVWRKTNDFHLDPLPTTSQPDESQLRAFTTSQRMFPSPDNHGHFRPWAILNMPELTSAFRFVYPTLLVSGQEHAYLWNVVTAQLEKVITIASPEERSNFLTSIGRLSYVDVNERYAFTCAAHSLRIFDLTSQSLVLSLPAGIQSRDYYSNDRFEVRWIKNHSTSAAAVTLKLNPYPSDPPLMREEFFFAVHVSPCGKHLAILFTGQRLLIIRDFQRLIPNPATSNTSLPTLRDISTEINFASPLDTVRFSRYFAFENNRIGVACTAGIFIVNLDSPLIAQGDLPHKPTSEVWPNIWVSCISKFCDSMKLQAVSCLQMTGTGLFVAYDGGHEKNEVWQTDFMPD